MKVDFFQIIFPKVARMGSFEELLATVAAMPDDASRTRDIIGQKYRLQSLAASDRICEGEMVRIRMDESPLVANTSGQIDLVVLESDQGIGSETAFLYDRHTKALLIQVNRNGVSAGNLAKYFEIHGTLDEAISAVRIPRPDMLASLSRIRTIRKFHVRIAGGYDPRLVVGHGPEGGAAIDLLNESYAPKIDVTISMGRGRGTLPVEKITEKARQLIGRETIDQQIDVENVQICGQYDDNSPADLKLLNFMMSEHVTVPQNSTRRVPYADRRSAIREAWERRRQQLTDLFVPH